MEYFEISGSVKIIETHETSCQVQRLTALISNTEVEQGYIYLHVTQAGFKKLDIEFVADAVISNASELKAQLKELMTLVTRESKMNVVENLQEDPWSCFITFIS